MNREGICGSRQRGDAPIPCVWQVHLATSLETGLNSLNPGSERTGTVSIRALRTGLFGA